MIDPGEAAVEDQQGQDGEAVDSELLLFQPFRDKKISIEIIEDDQQDVVADKECSQIPFFIKGEIPGSWIKYKGDYEEADPGGNMDNDLYKSLVHGDKCNTNQGSRKTRSGR